jgi:hypothetical protein
VFQPIDDHRVLVARRDARPDSPHLYIERFDVGEGRRFRAVFDGDWASEVDGGGSRLLSLGKSFLMLSETGASHSVPHLVSLDLEHGDVTWEATKTGERIPPVADLLPIDGGALVFTVKDLPIPAPTEIVAYDERGHERWRHESEPLLDSVVVRGKVLVLGEVLSTELLDLSTGQSLLKVPKAGPACVNADVVWSLSGRELRAFNLTTRAGSSPIVLPKSTRFIASCGTRNGVVWMPVADMESETAVARLIGVEAATSQLVADIELGPLAPGGAWMGPNYSVERAHSDQAPIGADAPRFVPVSIYGARASLVVVDLDKAAIASFIPAAEPWTGLEVERMDDAYYVFEKSNQILARLDGRAGAITAAVTYQSRPKLGFGKVWVRNDWEVGTLDASSLALTWSTGPLKVDDAQARVSGLLSPSAARQ